MSDFGVPPVVVPWKTLADSNACEHSTNTWSGFNIKSYFVSVVVLFVISKQFLTSSLKFFYGEMLLIRFHMYSSCDYFLPPVLHHS